MTQPPPRTNPTPGRIDQETWAQRTRLTMPSKLELIESAIQQVEQFLAERGVCVPRLSIVLTELIRNAVVHGNAGADAKHVTISVRIIGPNVIRTSVRDQGEGFLWRALDYDISECPGRLRQRGLLLVAAFARTVAFSDTGSRITVEMDCEPAGRSDRPEPSQEAGASCGGKMRTLDEEASTAPPSNGAADGSQPGGRE